MSKRNALLARIEKVTASKRFDEISGDIAINRELGLVKISNFPARSNPQTFKVENFIHIITQQDIFNAMLEDGTLDELLTASQQNSADYRKEQEELRQAAHA